MEKLASIQELLMRSRRLPWLIVGLALFVLGGTIFITRQQLRSKVREQIIGRDGQVLHAVAQMHFDEMTSGDQVPDVGQQLTLVLKTSRRIRGVMGARLLDANGLCIEAFDVDVLESNLSARDLPDLKKLIPVSHFDPSVRLSKNFLPREKRAVDLVAPLLEVNIPLHAQQSERLIGIAQFLIEGESMAREFQRLDRHLTFQSLAAFGVGGSVLVVALGWAFRRLRSAHELLATRAGQLLQANQELALTARTSALGAVSAHLIHGLKNPLSGLQNFVAQRTASELPRTGEEWEQAVASTRRMQSMINEVVNVLREEESGLHYEVTIVELAQSIASRVQPLAREMGVTFSIHRETDAVLANRTANLVTLILMNLVQNSLQFTPSGKSVSLRFAPTKDHLICEVHDEGPGLPDELKQNLFVPCQSKKGGSGIGLAISKQLANHLGAELELKSTSSHGCVFALTLPLTLCSGRITSEVSERA